jgi:hypothetical protein
MSGLTITDLPERIGRRLHESEGHWLWTGWHNQEGYPYCSLDGRDQPAHRVVWQLLIGLLGDETELDHLCVTPSCCNPIHLEPVSHAENMRRIQDRQKACRRRGHDWTNPRNVRIRPSGRRYCAECDRIDQRERYARRRAA